MCHDLKNSFQFLRYAQKLATFLISRISQEPQRIFTSAGIFFNLYKVLFFDHKKRAGFFVMINNFVKKL